MFGQDFDVKVWSKDFEFRNLIKICVRTCFFGKQNSTLGSVVPLAMFCTCLFVWLSGALDCETLSIEFDILISTRRSPFHQVA